MYVCMYVYAFIYLQKGDRLHPELPPSGGALRP